MAGVLGGGFLVFVQFISANGKVRGVCIKSLMAGSDIPLYDFTL